MTEILNQNTDVYGSIETYLALINVVSTNREPRNGECDCSICYEAFVDNGNRYFTCEHVFCYDCMTKLTKSKCPICRGPLHFNKNLICAELTDYFSKVVQQVTNISNTRRVSPGYIKSYVHNEMNSEIRRIERLYNLDNDSSSCLIKRVQECEQNFIILLDAEMERRRQYEIEIERQRHEARLRDIARRERERLEWANKTCLQKFRHQLYHVPKEIYLYLFV